MTRAPRTPGPSARDIPTVLARLRAAGHRVSAPAQLVLETLFAADGPVSAELIAEAGAAAGRRLELTSVYRNLERLQALGVVTHVHVGHGAGLYELAQDEPREYLVCEHCGRVTSVDAARLDAIRAALRETFGYEARFDHFPIHGYCASCEATLATAGAGASHVHRHPKEARVHDHDHEHDDAHSHEHRHGAVTHSHPHIEHDHEHVEHEHEHSHGDRVHSHPHVHQAGLEHEHEHDH